MRLQHSGATVTSMPCTAVPFACFAPCCSARHDNQKQPRSGIVFASPIMSRRRELVAFASTSAAVGRPQLPEMPVLPPLDGTYAATHSYSALANWIIPQVVLLGRYPYVEPSRCASRELGEQQIQQLLEAGVTTFVCLQAELPPQAQLPVGGRRGFLPYRPVATMIAASRQAPPTVEITGSIRNSHLDQFLPQRRQSNGATNSPASTSQTELSFLHCPIVDLSIPTTEQVQGLIAELVSRLERGEVLYIHCWGGRGRAGMIGACLLATLYGVDAEEALRRVQLAFDTRFDEGRPSPETEEQSNFVRQYVAGLQSDLQRG